MTWNLRVMYYPPHDGSDEIVLQINSVYYENDVPHGYGEQEFVHGESINDIKWKIGKMIEATTKPILWTGDRFPEEYIP